MKSLAKILILLSTTIFLLQIACSKSPTSSVSAEGSIKFSIKSVSNSAANKFNKAVNSVTITSARVVIKEIEFESSVEDSVDFEFEEPFVQDLVVDTSLHEIGTVQVPFGTYKELEIEIDKLKEKDGTAFTQNPELQNLSIRVEGYLNGDPNSTFVFTSDLEAEQEREFSPPLVIDENSPSTNVVLTINMGMWFVDSNNNPLDPTLSENRSRIEKNIKNSLKVFKDEDDDGKEDHEEDDND